MRGNDNQNGVYPPKGDGSQLNAPLGELFPRLVEDIRTLVAAEVRLYRAEAVRAALPAGVALGMIIGALTLVQGALIAMLVGLIMLLAPALGIGWATLTVTLGALVVAVLLALLAWKRIATIIEPEKRI